MTRSTEGRQRVRRVRLGLAFATAALLVGGSPWAAQAADGPSAAPFKAPTFSPAFVSALQKLPDWNGDWALVGGLMFAPEQAYNPEDPARKVGGLAYGPLPGAKLVGLPYKPEYQAKYDAVVAKAVEGLVDDPAGNCIEPHGMPRSLGAGAGLVAITVLPDEVRMTWFYMNGTRRIYTDGRKHPSGDDLFPSYMGHSIGHWEGDTLVVDTVGMKAGIYDRSGAPHSDQVHLVERIRMTAPDTLEFAMTIEDPVMFTRPWKVTRRYTRRPPDPTVVWGEYCDVQPVDMSSGYQRAILPGEQPPAAPAK